MKNRLQIPVIDLFSGPGGLGEGFSRYPSLTNPAFKIRLSIEKDLYAHRTLKLRSLYRQFNGVIPKEYFDYVKGSDQIKSIEELYEKIRSKYPEETKEAEQESWKPVTLGSTPANQIHERIKKRLNGAKKWVLIGGPPCQAYSLAGRSRMLGIGQIRKDQDPNKIREGRVQLYSEDKRHVLYKEYLSIIGVHKPPIFLMENVKGILSSKRLIKGKFHGIFEIICNDLRNPSQALSKRRTLQSKIDPDLSYEIYSISPSSETFATNDDPRDFIVRSEQHGIPQARHRIFILGIRSDLKNIWSPSDRLVRGKKIRAGDVLSDCPAIRSSVSQRMTSPSMTPMSAISEMLKKEWFHKLPALLQSRLTANYNDIESKLDVGSKFQPDNEYKKKRIISHLSDWLFSDQLCGYLNHESKSHMKEDLWRYFFAATFAELQDPEISPKIEDFPEQLWPKHKNIDHSKPASTIFPDRFRVQVKSKPSTTITSHLAKDGHYYIHYDPKQCRCLTVREAARLQTFPDDYFFEGPRTEQYKQVGNAVPPYLAYQIAKIVHEIARRF